MKKNFTQLIAGVHIARYYEVSVASLLLLFFMLLANMATAQTINPLNDPTAPGLVPSCATVGENLNLIINGTGFRTDSKKWGSFFESYYKG